MISNLQKGIQKDSALQRGVTVSKQYKVKHTAIKSAPVFAGADLPC